MLPKSLRSAFLLLVMSLASAPGRAQAPEGETGDDAVPGGPENGTSNGGPPAEAVHPPPAPPVLSTGADSANPPSEPQAETEGEPIPELAEGPDDGIRAASQSRSLGAEVGWSVGTIGGIGRRHNGLGGPAWHAGFEFGYAGAVLGGRDARLMFFGGVRALAYGLDDLREPNRDDAYVGFGALVATPIHIGSPDISFIIRPNLGLLVSRETVINPSGWFLAGTQLGVAMRVTGDIRVTLTLGGEAWIPFSQADTTWFASFRLGLESTWRNDRPADRPVSVAELLRRYETEQFADLVDSGPAGQCLLSSVPTTWRSIQRDDGEPEARCGDQVLRAIPQGRCALFVGVAHYTMADVNMRTYSGADGWERRDALDPGSSDEVPDFWPVNVICNFSEDELLPTVEVQRASEDSTAMTVRRYDIAFDRATRALTREHEPRPMAADGEIAAGGTCALLHLAQAGDNALLRLPVGETLVRVMAPAVADVRATLRRETVREGSVFASIEMRSDRPVRVQSVGDAMHPYLLIENPVIGAAVIVCVDTAGEN